MTVRTHEVPFKFSYPAGVKDVALSVKVTIYQLLPAEAHIDENDVILTRPTFDGMAEKMINTESEAETEGQHQSCQDKVV